LAVPQDFFEAQDNARRTSKWLIVVFIPVVAVMATLVAFVIAPAYFYIAVGISNVASGEAGAGVLREVVFSREFFLFAALFMTSIIIIASMFKHSARSAGGGIIAVGELIRVVCASLDCPLPPILIDNN
jgi:hypothetical protein